MRISSITLASALALTVSACGGGTGGTTGDSQQDTYSPSAFNFVDPEADEFHPLGQAVSSATRLDETLTMYANYVPGTPWVLGSLLLRDDSLHANLASAIGTSQAGMLDFRPLDACTGDLDGDGRLEAIFTGIVEGDGDHLGIRVSQPDQLGQVVGYENFDTEAAGGTTGWWTNLLGTHCTAGDLDGDGVDELIVMETRLANGGPSHETKLRVIKRFDDAGVPVFSDVYTVEYIGFFGRVAVGQFDEDDALELVVAHGSGGTPAAIFIDLLDDLNSGMAFLDEVAHYTGNDQSIELCVGEFDGDPLDEVGVGLQTQLADIGVLGGTYEHFRTWTIAYDWAGTDATLIQQTAHDTSPSPDWRWDAIGARSRDRFVTADMDGDGLDEMCWLHVVLKGIDLFLTPDSYDWDINLRTWQPSTGAIGYSFLRNTTGQSDFFGSGFKSGYRAGDISVIDPHGSGRDNLLITLGTHDKVTNEEMLQLQVEQDAGGQNTVIQQGWLPGFGISSVPIQTGGDYDGEGMRVKYTGVKYPTLPDPIPMALLAAPPTKAGIAQNYDFSGSSYTVSDGVSDAYSVSTALSLSASVGFEFEDLFGAFGTGAKVTLTNTVENETGTSSTLTTSQTFSGSYDQNAIVFEGTLNMAYEYEVVEAYDDAAIGSIISINVPVATKVFKWTADYFNANVDAANQIPADVFTQTIGDPASYPSQAALSGLLASNGGAYEGWEGTSLTVGQGTSTNAIALSLEDVLSEGEKHSFGVEEGAEFKVGGATFGSSMSLSSSQMYTVTVSRETVYDGVVGDINSQDYPGWLYDVGMVVYTRKNLGEKPVQVLQYWTDPLGSNY